MEKNTLEFRNLEADEIECRVQSMDKYNGSWAILLLYKDARCDMNILDETVGCMGWKRSHLRENKNCIVEIFDSINMQWVGKEDTGSESNSDAQKGLASDSFKRACFNWGIGRELYTKIPIFIKPNPNELMEDTKNTYTDFKTKEKKNCIKLKSKVKYHVGYIKTINKKIVALEIMDNDNVSRFQWKA